MLRWLKSRTLPVLQETWDGWQHHDGFLLSAAMAYYAAFSLFPLCIVLIAVLGFAMQVSSQPDDSQRTLIKFVAEYASPWVADQLRALLPGVKSHAGVNGPIGAIALLVTTIGVFFQFDYIFNRIYSDRRPASSPTETTWIRSIRKAVYDRLTAFVMLLAVGAMLLAIFIANLVLTWIRSYLDNTIPIGDVLWKWGQFGFSIVTDGLLFALIYRVMPKVKIRWRDALIGGTFVAVVWIIGQHLLVSFVIGKGYTAYGVVGSFIAVMIWLYYASAVLFFGAEFVRALTPSIPSVKESECPPESSATGEAPSITARIEP